MNKNIAICTLTVLALVCLRGLSLYAQESLPPASAGSEVERISAAIEQLRAVHKETQDGISRLERSLSAINSTLSSLQDSLDKMNAEMSERTEPSPKNPGGSSEVGNLSKDVSETVEGLKEGRRWLRFIIVGVGVSVGLNMLLLVMLIVNWNKSPQVIIRYKDDKESEEYE
jgi:hypothetical protein